ncbi:MAG: hypothetical protein WAU28_02640 [Candidatus Moraniibacteriota bacterium]
MGHFLGDEFNPISLFGEALFDSSELVLGELVEPLDGVRVGDCLMAVHTQEKLDERDDGDSFASIVQIHADIRESEIRVQTIRVIHGLLLADGKTISPYGTSVQSLKLVKGQYFLYHQGNKSSREYYGSTTGKSDGKDRVAL